MTPAFRVFISCVSKEFGSYRTDLRTALTSAGREIKIQEEIADGAGTLLEKLDAYITKCQAVIHLIGDGVGEKAKPAEVRWLVNERYPDLPQVMPELEAWLKPETCPFSYTQWECLLAIYHRVPCYIYLADSGSRREADWNASPESIVEQRAHIERLRQLGQDRRSERFSDAREIAIRFINSYFSDGGQATAHITAGRVFQWPELPHLPAYDLADREVEFRAFQTLVTGQSRERILLIHGPSDRGKSVLLVHFLELAQKLPGLRVSHAEFKTALPLSEVLSNARRDLRSLRFPRFDREATHERRPEMLRAAFLEDIEESPEPVLLILDAFEQATAEAKRWVEDHLMPRCRQHDGLRMIIAGKEVPDPSGALARLVLGLELTAIRDPNHWLDYKRRVLNLTSVPDDHLATLVSAAEGSPRAISNLLANLRRKAAQS